MSESTNASFIISRSILYKALSYIVRFVDKRTISAAVVANIKILISGNFITISTTDERVFDAVIIKVPATIKREGSFAINGSTFQDIIRNLEESEVIIEQVENILKIVCLNSEFVLPYSMYQKCYSEEEKDNFKPLCSINLFEHDIIFNKTKIAICNDETRYNLTGLYIESDNDKLIAASTDSHKLANVHCDIEVKAKIHFIMPRKAVLEIAKLDINLENKINISYLENSENFVTKVLFHYKDDYFDITIIINTLAVEFPNYKAVIPKVFDNFIIANTAGLIKIIERVSSIFSDRNKGIKLRFISENKINISANLPDGSNAQEDFNIEYKGKINSFVVVNHGYLLDILKSLKGENIKISTLNTMGGILLHSENDNKVLYLVMPLVT
ncbi:MAG: DNA polymerase III subunit beta [Anaplasmataceae bacterium]|nr:DNA polymerase III subunit beta [Anaplasmataceae bacterium]